VWASSISNLSVLSVDVTGAFGADADNQALERSVLAFVLIAFLLACLADASHIMPLRNTVQKKKLIQAKKKGAITTQRGKGQEV
jgi:hypothetical protein